MIKHIFAFPYDFEFCETNNLLLILTGWEFIVGIAVARCLFARMVDLKTSSKMDSFYKMHCIQAAGLCRHRPVSKRPSHQRNQKHLTVSITVINKQIFLFLNEYLSSRVIDAVHDISSILEDAH